MREPVEASQSAWYSRWLVLAWFAGPALGAALQLLEGAVPAHAPLAGALHLAMLLLDIVHLIHWITDFFTVPIDSGEGSYRFLIPVKYGNRPGGIFLKTSSS